MTAADISLSRMRSYRTSKSLLYGDNDNIAISEDNYLQGELEDQELLFDRARLYLFGGKDRTQLESHANQDEPLDCLYTLPLSLQK